MAAIAHNFQDALERDDENSDNDDENSDIVDTTGIRDATIVAPNTRKTYTSDLLQLIQWVQVNENNWLTTYGNDQMIEMSVPRELESPRQCRVRVMNSLTRLLENASTQPIIHLDRVIPRQYIEYILSLRRSNKNKNENNISKSRYGNKRAALFHLFRLHNGKGFDHDFKTELTNLANGLFRQKVGLRNDTNINDRTTTQYNNNNQENGEKPMSMELYQLLSEKFLKFGTLDGVFGHCYLVLSWNLSCCCKNTAHIQLGDFRWAQFFDSFSISFSRNEQPANRDPMSVGTANKFRHLFSNPTNPLICPVLALAMYFTCCFRNVVAEPVNALFPGVLQYVRFKTLLQKTVNDNWDLVSQMGYNRGEIGASSISEGAVSYLLSLPNGPPAEAICSRAGPNTDEDKYLCSEIFTADDLFVGRCLTLRSPLCAEFASSPPYFVNEGEEWINGLCGRHFTSVASVGGMARLIRRCLASILYHYQWLVDFLGVNHIFLTSSLIHRNLPVQDHIKSVVVTYPWNDNSNHFSGIPPDVAIRRENFELRQEMKMFKDSFHQELLSVMTRTTRRFLEVMDDAIGRTQEQNVTDVSENLQHNLEQQLNNNVQLQAVVPVPMAVERVNVDLANNTKYSFHEYDGTYKSVPRDWRFPRCNVFHVWRQWWIGDAVRNIPPLKALRIHDVKHLDNIELGEEELHGRKGPFKFRRRKTSKTLADLKYLMEYITGKVQERNLLPAEITIATVDRMFQDVSDLDLFQNHPKMAQLDWKTMVHKLRAEQKKVVAVSVVNLS